MLERLLGIFSEWAKRSNTEHALQGLDDWLLDDIGFTRRRPLLGTHLDGAFLDRIEPNEAAHREMVAAVQLATTTITQPPPQSAGVLSEAISDAYRPDNSTTGGNSLAA